MKGWRATGALFVVALVVRAVIVAWAAHRFPPAADGVFYERFADRLARGLGYTTAWPDGVVTYAAHYPVGYPLLLSLAYRVLGRSTAVAMGVNALIGAVGSASAHRLAARELPSTRSFAAGLLVGLHPVLVLYTPAIMTEGVAAALVLIACAALPTRGTRYPSLRLALAGLVFGVATLVRPQIIALAPVLAWLVVRRLRSAAVVLAAALLTVAPWTVRNCARMHRCALVSVNGGWNLLIGAQTNSGAWTELVTPPECSTVWDEAAKDTCFEIAARRAIRSDPMAWLAKVPSKLSATLDFFAAGPAYLSRSNPAAAPYALLVRLVLADVLSSRILLIAALGATMPIWRLLRHRTAPLRERIIPGARILVCIAGAVFGCTRHAWVGYLVLALLCLFRQRGERRSTLRLVTAVVLLGTMATHAVFFGSGRYGLLVVPWVTLAAFACVRPKALSTSPT